MLPVNVGITIIDIRDFVVEQYVCYLFSQKKKKICVLFENYLIYEKKNVMSDISLEINRLMSPGR